MPAEYDVAIVEGAVTTEEHVELLRDVRSKAAAVIALGTCAVTGGIPAMAGLGDYDGRYEVVYGNGDGEQVARGRIVPAPIDRYIDVDYDKGTGTGRKLWSMVNKGPYLAVQIGW